MKITTPEEKEQCRVLLEGVLKLSWDEPRPLKVGIFEDMVKRLKELGIHFESKAPIRSAIKFYTNRLKYKHALIKHQYRYDLDGNIVGEITPNVKKDARAFLSERFIKKKKRMRAEAKKLKQKNNKKGTEEKPKKEEIKKSPKPQKPQQTPLKPKTKKIQSEHQEVKSVKIIHKKPSRKIKVTSPSQ